MRTDRKVTEADYRHQIRLLQREVDSRQKVISVLNKEIHQLKAQYSTKNSGFETQLEVLEMSKSEDGASLVHLRAGLLATKAENVELREQVLSMQRQLDKGIDPHLASQQEPDQGYKSTLRALHAERVKNKELTQDLKVAKRML